ncbi:MAG: hypothetical protein LBK95_04605, partial [Bifidobacteriaceae bacterium]|nr:hypothetical protein [Bifidobacteriaceae bacterium]
DQGGVAYGNTFLEATTDAGCVAQAKLAGAVKEAGGQTPTDAASQNPTSGAVAASGGPGTPGTSPASALERTGASSAPVAGFGMVLVAAGFALCARRARGRLGRRTGQHARVTGA